jgi:transcriptional regulator with XRE-family HTH domain
MKLSVRIRTARMRAGLSQSELAQRIGVGRTAVVNWESETNRGRPSSERLEEICRQTGVSWEWLATGRGHATPSLETTLAVDAELVEDPIERRLLQAFRNGNSRFRRALIALLEA